jgi:hypothetical protein
VRALNLRGEFRRQFALRFNRLEDRRLSLRKQAQLDDTIVNLADLFFVEPAGLILAIARDERNGVAVVE